MKIQLKKLPKLFPIEKNDPILFIAPSGTIGMDQRKNTNYLNLEQGHL